MGRSSHWGRDRSVRSALAAVAGVVLGVLMVLASVGTSVHSGAAGSSTKVPVLSEVDPQFLPQTFSDPHPNEDAYYGTAVALSSAYAVVAAPGQSGPVASDEEYAYGCVYIDRLATGVTTPVCSTTYTSVESFGSAVAVGGGYVAVGSPYAGVSEALGPTVKDAGTVSLYSASTGSLVATYVSPNPTYDGWFGYSVALSGSTLVIGAPGENNTEGDTVYTEGGHAYEINLATQATTMFSSPLEAYDGQFGWSVAVSGTSLVIGAPGEYGSSGDAYLFSTVTGDLARTFPGTNFETEARVGSSVAVNGSLVVIGVPDVPEVLGYGTAWVFNTVNGTNYTVSNPRITEFGMFGSSVAASADWFAIGAPGQLAGGSDSGATYLYSSATGALVSSNFSSPGWPDDGEFGSAIGLSGNELLVGAPSQAAGALDYAGHAYLFSKIPLTITPNDPTLGERFGASVSVYNGELLIGAPNAQVGSSVGQGLFEESSSESGPFTVVTTAPGPGEAVGTAVTQSSDILAYSEPNVSADVGIVEDILPYPNEIYSCAGGDHLGRTLASYGPTLVMGGHDCASDFNYSYDSGSLAEFSDPNGTAGSEFGFSVAAWGMIAAVGAPTAFGGDGAVYLYNVNSGDLIRIYHDPTPQSGGGFGTSVALTHSTLVVGAPNDSAAPGPYGHVYVFSTTSHALYATLAAPTDSDKDGEGSFGTSVADNGGTIAVADPTNTAFGVPDAGNVYLYSGTSYSLEDRYNSPSPATGGGFGESISLGPGGKLLVGAFSTNGERSAGVAYLFFL